MDITHWIRQHPAAWHRAVAHPFLDACAAGTIEASSFNRWLAQDYLFVVDFTRLAARLAQTCPVAHLDTLLAGLAALKDELSWFRNKVAERGLDPGTPKHGTCAAYCDFMRILHDAPYAVQAAAFWAIERAYNEAWQRPGPMKPPYDEFADRWGNPGFTAYVEQLAAQAGEALTRATADELKQAEQVFLDIAELESRFWQMAFG